MDVLEDTRLWAERNFAGSDLGDQRRTRRLVESAAKIAAHPEKPFTQVFDWNELRGFYRLCDQAEARLPAVMSPHWEQTRQAMCQQPLVLILHDTTELDFTHRRHLTGIGQIGNALGRGFHQHNSLAVVPQSRQILGLAHQQLHVRKPAPAGDSSYRRKRRECESLWWLDGYRAAGAAPKGSCWIDVCDRGGDDYAGMCVSRSLDHHFLFRTGKTVTCLSPLSGTDKNCCLIMLVRWLAKATMWWRFPDEGDDRLERHTSPWRRHRSGCRHLKARLSPAKNPFWQRG